MTARMIENIGTGLEVGGVTALIASITLTAWNKAAEYFNIEAVSPYLIFLTGLVGLLYMFSKWRGQRLSNKHKKMEIEVLEELRKEKKR
jgi:uncharacterized membrane protein